MKPAKRALWVWCTFQECEGLSKIAADEKELYGCYVLSRSVKV